jgi:hypothetical protein
MPPGVAPKNIPIKFVSFRILPSPGLLRGVKWFKTDVSGLPIGHIFKVQTVNHKPSSCTAWPLKKRPISSPETSVSNHPTACNNPEHGRIQFNRGRSLRYCVFRKSSGACYRLIEDPM